MAARARIDVRLALLGFVAGALAFLLFHQVVGAAYYGLGISPNRPYAMTPVPPFGVPRAVSLAFWSGVWGIVFAAIVAWLPRRPGAFLAAGFVFGIVGPAFFGWFVLAPLRGQAAAQGWQLVPLLRGAFINGMWGLGTAFFLLLAGRLGLRR